MIYEFCYWEAEKQTRYEIEKYAMEEIERLKKENEEMASQLYEIREVFDIRDYYDADIVWEVGHIIGYYK